MCVYVCTSFLSVSASRRDPRRGVVAKTGSGRRRRRRRREATD
jgi:hypothetical protein